MHLGLGAGIKFGYRFSPSFGLETAIAYGHNVYLLLPTRKATS